LRVIIRNNDLEKDCAVNDLNYDDVWTVPERPSNKEQMIQIADNNNLVGEDREDFFNAVRGFGGRSWQHKACYANSQDFFMDQDYLGDNDLLYEEGYVIHRLGVPIQHAWLRWGGKVLDLTLGFDNEIVPENYFPYFDPDRNRGLEVVRASLRNQGMWDTVIQSGELTEKDFERFNEVRDKVFGLVER
jgi:hypothetical protein